MNPGQVDGKCKNFWSFRFGRGCDKADIPERSGSCLNPRVLAAVALLPCLSACQFTVSDSERDLLLRKSMEVNKGYLNFFRGTRSEESSRRRLQTIVALTRKITQESSNVVIDKTIEELMDVVWRDTIQEAYRIYKPESKEMREIIALATTYFGMHSETEKAEQLYRNDIAALTSDHKGTPLENLVLKPQSAVAVNDDMQALALLLDRQGKKQEAKEYRRIGLLLRERANAKTNANLP